MVIVFFSSYSDGREMVFFFSPLCRVSVFLSSLREYARGPLKLTPAPL